MSECATCIDKNYMPVVHIPYNICTFLPQVSLLRRYLRYSLPVLLYFSFFINTGSEFYSMHTVQVHGTWYEVPLQVTLRWYASLCIQC